jgi:hypothetical protein
MAAPFGRQRVQLFLAWKQVHDAQSETSSSESAVALFILVFDADVKMRGQ